MSTDEFAPLTPEELAGEGVTALPDKEVISILDLAADIDLAIDGAAPIDLAVALNANVVAPIDAAVSANLLSDGSNSQALADQGVWSRRRSTADAVATGIQDSTIDQSDTVEGGAASGGRRHRRAGVAHRGHRGWRPSTRLPPLRRATPSTAASWWTPPATSSASSTAPPATSWPPTAPSSARSTRPPAWWSTRPATSSERSPTSWTARPWPGPTARSWASSMPPPATCSTPRATWSASSTP